MPNNEYTLNALTEAAGVSARTVRYYISEGLIPPPTTAGRRASYTTAHLNRLRLIGQLKHAYLPLREIRRQLDRMTDSEIEAMLQRPETPGNVIGSPIHRRAAEDASSYLAKALHRAPIRQLLYPSRGEQLSIVDSPGSGHFEEDEPQDPAATSQMLHRVNQS